MHMQTQTKADRTFKMKYSSRHVFTAEIQLWFAEMSLIKKPLRKGAEIFSSVLNQHSKLVQLYLE